MTTSRTVEEKVADWWTAYQALRDTITPSAFREMTGLAKAPGVGEEFNVQAINIGMVAARVVFANDRAAATVAAMLTQSGIKPLGVDYGDEME